MKEQKLKELKATATKLVAAEKRVDGLRAERNKGIFEACSLYGATEREAASASGTSPTYAHRCVAERGRPGVGWAEPTSA